MDRTGHIESGLAWSALCHQGWFEEWVPRGEHDGEEQITCVSHSTEYLNDTESHYKHAISFSQFFVRKIGDLSPWDSSANDTPTNGKKLKRQSRGRPIARYPTSESFPSMIETPISLGDKPLIGGWHQSRGSLGNHGDLRSLGMLWDWWAVRLVGGTNLAEAWGTSEI
jgi:hypothetical protein